MPTKGKTLLSLEYAKSKNRPTDFTLVTPSLCGAGNFAWEQRIEVGVSDDRSFEMKDDPSLPAATIPDAKHKPLSPAAARALAEAEARRKAAEANAKPSPRERSGPQGPEPTRYGDWERKGLASDF